MRIPSFTPPARSTVPTLADLREALRIARAAPARFVTETETVADLLELDINNREIAAGLRPGAPA